MGDIIVGPWEPAGISIEDAFDKVEVKVLEHTQLYRYGCVVEVEVGWLGLIGCVEYGVEGVDLNRVVFVAVAAVECET